MLTVRNACLLRRHLQVSTIPVIAITSRRMAVPINSAVALVRHFDNVLHHVGRKNIIRLLLIFRFDTEALHEALVFHCNIAFHITSVFSRPFGNIHLLF